MKPNDTVSVHVVACDIEKYSQRTTIKQTQVVTAFTVILNASCRKVIGIKDKDIPLPASEISIMPTGDGAVVVFVNRQGNSLHLNLACHLLKAIDQHNRKFPCEISDKDGWCECHSRFRVRIGIGEGKCVTYTDINGKVNIAGNPINYAHRAMAVADPMQVILTKQAYNDLIQLDKDPELQNRFRCYRGVVIKHGESVDVYQYVAENTPGLNRDMPGYAERSLVTSSSAGGLSSDSIQSIAEELAGKLSSDWEWAASALERAHAGAYADTLFGDRKGHFQKEKERIAEYFAPRLFARALHLTNAFRPVYLLIDSGTTLFPLFRLLGKQAVDAYIGGIRAVEHIRIVTNNLPGVLSLMEHGRPNPDNRYSDLAIGCQLLPGVPLPVYKAVTGPLTEKAIKQLKSNSPQSGTSQRGPAFIGVITGNWIRLRRTGPPCPIPLARGAGHLKFKQVLMDASDEVFVVAPLGKCFCNIDLNDLNQALGYDAKAKDPGQTSYKELHVSDRKAKEVSLVSTFRKDHRLLHDLGTYLQSALQGKMCTDDRAFSLAPLKEVGHSIIEFDQLPTDASAEEEIELPHKPTREGLARKRLLYPTKTSRERYPLPSR